MANNYSNQEKAYKEFFDGLSSQAVEGTSYDITGWDGLQIIQLLIAVVNDTRFKNREPFYMKINGAEVFKLLPNPLPDQPGNGLLWRGEGRGRSYIHLLTQLQQKYGSDTYLFAQDLKKLFKSNKDIGSFHSATQEIYMILLFEIARRQAKSSSDATRESPKKRGLDKLPIGSAIVKIVKLLEVKGCTFRDVFSPEGKFHCFSSTQNVRETAIRGINDAHLASYAKCELREMFSSEQQEQEETGERNEPSESDESVADVTRGVENYSISWNVWYGMETEHLTTGVVTVETAMHSTVPPVYVEFEPVF